MLVFFDLPVVTAKEKKDATKFRKFLLKDGYNKNLRNFVASILN